MPDYERVEDVDVVASWKRTHQTDEVTRVIVLEAGDTFLAVVYDLTPQGDPITSELIDWTLTAEEAEKRAEAWLEENPKGIKGDGVTAGLGGLLGS